MNTIVDTARYLDSQAMILPDNMGVALRGTEATGRGLCLPGGRAGGAHVALVDLVSILLQPMESRMRRSVELDQPRVGHFPEHPFGRSAADAELPLNVTAAQLCFRRQLRHYPTP